MKVKYHSYQLKLAKVFKISYETRTHQPTLIVELNHGGFTGYGESTAISYYNVTVDEMIDKLEEVTPFIENHDFENPLKLWNEISEDLIKSGHSFLLSAIDCAAHDLYGKLHGTRIYSDISPEGTKTPLSNYTISIGTAKEMIDQIKDKPWPVYKIKLGADTPPETLLEVRKHTDAKLRIDANAAWDLEIATKWLPILIETGVELIEQPFAIKNTADLDEFRKISPIAIVADESCQTEADVDECAKHFDAINIKLMKCGGLTPALRMVENAKKHGLKLMAGCMTESSVGISAMTQLATELDYIDADGAVLIANDPATGVEVVDGKIVYSEGFGAGIELIEELIKKNDLVDAI
ncbi:MAG: dipeptide epimerase [Ichthyobacteriaceae bacterium]|nr:dipeptide epimerase [Ichthyobacteriaceae bacterium]